MGDHTAPPSPTLTQYASLCKGMNFPGHNDQQLRHLPQPIPQPSSWPYCSVTETGSCLCVVSSTARYILVSSSTTCSLTNRKSPLEPTDDILGRGKKKKQGKDLFFSPREQPERHLRPRGRGSFPITSSPPQPCDAPTFSSLRPCPQPALIPHSDASQKAHP